MSRYCPFKDCFFIKLTSICQPKTPFLTLFVHTGPYIRVHTSRVCMVCLYIVRYTHSSHLQITILCGIEGLPEEYRSLRVKKYRGPPELVQHFRV
jgi:hypothetical protein